MTNDGLKQKIVEKPDRLLQIAQLPQATKDRIAHIDFTLLFKGEAVRADLVDRFSIAAAQATKDFTMYRELAPGNIEYDQKLKLHKRGEAFAPCSTMTLRERWRRLAKGTEMALLER